MNGRSSGCGGAARSIEPAPRVHGPVRLVGAWGGDGDSDLDVAVDRPAPTTDQRRIARGARSLVALRQRVTGRNPSLVVADGPTRRARAPVELSAARCHRPRRHRRRRPWLVRTASPISTSRRRRSLPTGRGVPPGRRALPLRRRLQRGRRHRDRRRHQRRRCRRRYEPRTPLEGPARASRTVRRWRRRRRARRRQGASPASAAQDTSPVQLEPRDALKGDLVRRGGSPCSGTRASSDGSNDQLIEFSNVSAGYAGRIPVPYPCHNELRTGEIRRHRSARVGTLHCADASRTCSKSCPG